MSEVKRILALVVIPGDTSQCVRNESYLLRSCSLHASPRQEFEVVLAGRCDLCDAHVQKGTPMALDHFIGAFQKALTGGVVENIDLEHLVQEQGSSKS
jgi:hypothetical protein